jgi:RNA polymerase subunit RPABC4/transcription elongation factor Spt4
MEDNLYRVESAVSATSSGNLTWEQWPYDCATALGMAGKRNPLGFAVVRYLSDGPNSSATWGVVLQLATELIKRGHDKAKANDTAWRALDAWNKKNCGHCGGRGVVSFDQKACPVCAGSGERDVKEWPEAVRAGLSCLLDAERWMEGQLAARLRK